MNEQAEIINKDDGSIAAAGYTSATDCENCLSNAGLTFKHRGYYLLVGEVANAPVLILHLPVIRQQMTELLGVLLPILINQNIPFAVPQNTKVHTQLLDGHLGYHSIGKVINLFPDRQAAETLISEVLKQTVSFKGIAVPNCRYLGNCLYAGFQTPEDFFNGCPTDEQARYSFPGIKAENLENKRWLTKNYLVVETLKNDVKGRVMKCLDCSSWLHIKWCIIKEGKANQCTDDDFRSIADRLRWQDRVHRQLAGKASLPEIKEILELGADTYLIMQYIEGINLNEQINHIHQGNIWTAIENASKRALLSYLMQVIEIIQTFHENGYVHRDINAGNFLITQDRKVVAIDIELCYHLKSGQPSPAFTLGTPGYMSPEQKSGNTPVFENDIYGLGGLLIKALTGLSPAKINTNSQEQLSNQLWFFIGNMKLVEIICRCFHQESPSRPEIATIQRALEVYDMSLDISGKTDPISINYPAISIKKQIQHSLEAITSDQMMGLHNEWLSKPANEENLIANELTKLSWSPFFYNGTAGILYVLGIAERLGYADNIDKPKVSRNIEYLENFMLADAEDQSGFYYGRGGLAVTWYSLINAGFIPHNIQNVNRIYLSLVKPNAGLSIAEGIAGQGLCMLSFYGQSQFPSFYEELQSIVQTLISAQLSDGSWLLKKDQQQTKKVKLVGFSYGIAGIAYFLLAFYEVYECSSVKLAILNALNWLLKQRKSINGHLVWSLNPKNTTIDPWLESGFSGVALTFIKAFQIFKDDRFKATATDALRSHPEQIASNYLSLVNGLSGLGEVYLEAYQAFKEPEWLDRARHIVSFLMCTSKQITNSCRCWLDGNDSQPTAGLMDGNCGIVHFLMRYLNPGKIRFPLTLN